MKALYSYHPNGSSDTTVTITASPARSYFTTANLKNNQPTKTYKTIDVSGNKFIKYDAGIGNKINTNTLFLNRFNFASFRVQGSDNDFATTPYDVLVSGLTVDEINDDNTSEIISDKYMHYWHDMTGFNYRFLRLYIPAQTPLFETTYFKVGNMLFGNYVEIWNPREGFSIEIQPNMNITTFDSGYESYYKKGKSYRVFEGEFDKITRAEYIKLVNGYNPMVLFLDWTSDYNQAYFVKNYGSMKRNYFLADILNVPISFREIV